jgi:hypothetical protein
LLSEDLFKGLRCSGNWWRLAVEAPSYDEELGEANQFHRNIAEKQRLLEIGQQYRHHYCNAEDLGNKKNAAISKARRQTL